MNSSEEILTVFSDGSDIYKNLVDKKGIEENKSFLLALAHKIVGHTNIIDDTDSIFQIRESYEMFVPHIGEQEYRALAYAVEHDYQIITEDKIFLFLYETMNFNTFMVSNSLSVVNSLLEPKDLLNLVKDLDEKGYSHIFNEEVMTQVLKEIIFKDPIYILKWKEKDFSDSIFEVMLHIIKKYGWLDWLVEYYIENYTIQIPSTTTKKRRSYITSNIEYIFELTGINKKISI